LHNPAILPDLRGKTISRWRSDAFYAACTARCDSLRRDGEKNCLTNIASRMPNFDNFWLFVLFDLIFDFIMKLQR
jgi:hypothetical protein